MRTEHNPLRFKPAPYRYKDIVCLVVTHLPCEDQPGYHKDRFEVVKTCLETMRGRAHRDHTFMVWDNDSNSTFRDWLQHIFEPDILVLSRNIGKNPARASAIQMLPLGSVVCYSDDDMYYDDNWLNPQMELLTIFPNVAAVSGNPVRTMFRWGVENTLAWAREHAKLEQGRYIPREWEDDFAISIGRDPQQHVEMSIKDVDYRITYEGKQAYATAHHAQFIGYAIKLLPALAYYNDSNAMSDEKPFDIAVDQAGLRLCTTQRYTRHIGNVLDESFRAEMENATVPG